MVMTDNGRPQEIWKDIPNYEGIYQISNFGNVKRLRNTKNIICKPSDDSRGYKQIVLTKDHKRKSFKVHRLVAITFIHNPNNYKEINHKDENKLNNNVDNLEWCSRKYNCNYGTRNYRCTKHSYRKVQQISKDGNIIKIYDSMKEAENETSIKYQSISQCCRNIKKSAGGYIWKYC